MGDATTQGGKPQLVVCGSIAIDRIMNFSGRYFDIMHAEKLSSLSISVLLDKLDDSRGGNGANITSALAQLGEKPVLIGSAGHDAQDYINDLTKLGVDASNIHLSDLPTASFNVITDREGNQVGGFFQGAMSDSQTVSFKPWEGQNVIAMVCPHNPEAMNRQVQECGEMGLRLIYDPGQQVADSSVDLETGIDQAQIVFANDYEREALCKRLEISAEELNARVPILITTLGKEGSLIQGYRVPEALKIGIVKVDAVDATGAGDAYRAGFLYGYLRQWDLKKCGQLGATVASFIIERHGTLQTLSQVDVAERYRLSFNEEIEL